MSPLQIICEVIHLPTFDDYVIDIDFNVSSDLVMEDLVYHPLVCGPGILKPEGHRFVRKYPPINNKCYLAGVSGGASAVSNILSRDLES